MDNISRLLQFAYLIDLNDCEYNEGSTNKDKIEFIKETRIDIINEILEHKRKRKQLRYLLGELDFIIKRLEENKK